MKILMIGGTRFFGKRFVQRMLDKGHSMTLLTRGQGLDDFGDRVARLVADRTSAEQLKTVIKSEYDLVVDNMLMNAQEANAPQSPLGVVEDYYMNVSKAQKAGFQVEALAKWMPSFIEELAQRS